MCREASFRYCLWQSVARESLSSRGQGDFLPGMCHHRGSQETCNSSSRILSHTKPTKKVAGLPDLTGESLDCLAPVQESMSLARFHHLSRVLFQEMGWTEEVASVLTTYSARRVLPSVADALGLSASGRVALGGWAGSSSSS